MYSDLVKVDGRASSCRVSSPYMIHISSTASFGRHVVAVITDVYVCTVKLHLDASDGFPGSTMIRLIRYTSPPSHCSPAGYTPTAAELLGVKRDACELSTLTSASELS